MTIKDIPYHGHLIQKTIANRWIVDGKYTLKTLKAAKALIDRMLNW